MSITTSPYTIVFDEIKTIIETEFAPEQFTVAKDNLHESKGRDRVDIGFAPVDETPWPQDINTDEHHFELRFYLIWPQNQGPSPDIEVDPSDITIYARRFKDAVRRHPRVGTSAAWFLRVENVTYPNDPTGNKTRFHARVTAVGNNPTYVETTA